MGFWLGCKRRSRVPRWMLPEKTEVGVVSRGDRMEAVLSVPLRPIAQILAEANERGVDVRGIFEGHRLGIRSNEKTNQESTKDKED